MSRAVLSFLDTCSRSPATVSVVSAPRTARERARVELTNEIKQEARRQLAEQGAAALSLRAVARELGMVSSALYRYFPSRDDLLTALITDAYDSVGQVAEEADAACDQDDVTGRWRAVGHAIRAWALDHPHEYALVYGSPVPGYRAPQDPIAPASRPTFVLTGILVDAFHRGALHPPDGEPPLGAAVRADAIRIRDAAMPGPPPPSVMRGVVAWTQLFGMITFELFGHLVGAIEDADAFFEHGVDLMALYLGLPAASRRRRPARR